MHLKGSNALEMLRTNHSTVRLCREFDIIQLYKILSHSLLSVALCEAFTIS